VKALELAPNQLHHFYRGGEAIARFRGTRSTDDRAPEDWVGSTTTIFGTDATGLSALPGGRSLRDAIAADAEAYLGPAHTARFGADTSLLVKLLDAGERLPVHFHPDSEFALRHLGLAHGKTEAWLIVAACGDAKVWLGFSAGVAKDTVAGWVERQDRAGMLAALNELPVSAADAVFVPAGFPHAIGEGILLVELQEPADLSVLLEWTSFEIDGERDAHLGLGFNVALESLRRTAVSADELSRLHVQTDELPESRPGVRTLLPPMANPFFRAERLQAAPSASLEPAFSILVDVMRCLPPHPAGGAA
jgi:mannose-6-phosphate isomerase